MIVKKAGTAAQGLPTIGKNFKNWSDALMESIQMSKKKRSFGLQARLLMQKERYKNQNKNQ